MTKNPLRWALAGLILLSLLEAARVYFIMPFPGSQLDDAASLSRVSVAYWLHQYTPWLRAMLLLLLITPVFYVLTKPAIRWHRWLVGGLMLVYVGLFFLVNQQMMADHMFLQPTTKRMVPLSQNKMPVNKLVLGVVEMARPGPIRFS